ncbi:hypothetical protein [Williamsia sp. CHRR-6]|uniref:hypothetical protein n=1 Tax=Williamsia sp. CHRR-6 TaxID=2835871 RepID=UPI001BDA54FC|nr:hypothetical protein [Williamsia sp. CHRR-6]MBT0566180.1 hypothetical protein [Williamsia sp. CHRR-6]
MMIVEQACFRPQPGELIEFRPTASYLAAIAAAPLREGPVSFLQETHFHGVTMAAAAGLQHQSYCGSYAEVETINLDDVDALARSYERFVRRHEALRAWFEMVDGQIRTHVVAPEDVAFEPVVVGDVLPEVQVQLNGSDDRGRWSGEMYDYARNLFSVEALALGSPGVVFGVVRRPRGFALFTATDHSVNDGISQGFAISEIMDYYREQVLGEELHRVNRMKFGSFLDFAAQDRAEGAEFTRDSPEIQDALEIFRDNGNAMPTCPIDLGLADGEQAPMKGHAFYLLDADAADRFEEITTPTGGIVGGLFAAVAITDYEFEGVEKYFGLTMLNARNLRRQGLSQGWFCRFAPVAFEVAGTATFTELAKRAHAAYARGRTISRAPVNAIAQAVIESTGEYQGMIKVPHVLSYIDFRRFPGAGREEFDNSFQFSGDGFTSNASMWINRDARAMYVGTQTPDTPYAQEVLTRYHQHLRHVFARIAEQGDYEIGSGAGLFARDAVAVTG